MVICPAAVCARVITRVFRLTALKSQKLPSITLNKHATTSYLIYDLETVLTLLENVFSKYLLNCISCKFESSVVSCQRLILTHAGVDKIIIYLKLNRSLKRDDVVIKSFIVNRLS